MKETQGLAFQHKTDFKLHRGMKQESKELQQTKKYMFPGPHLGFSPCGDDVGIPHIRKLTSWGSSSQDGSDNLLIDKFTYFEIPEEPEIICKAK